MVSLMRNPTIFIPEDLEAGDVCVIEDAEFIKGNIGKEVVLHQLVYANTVGVMTDEKGGQIRFAPNCDAWIVFSKDKHVELLAMFADGRVYHQEYIMVQEVHLKLLNKKVRPDIHGSYQSRIPMITS